MKDFLGLQSPHKARTISRHPIGLTEVTTPQPAGSQGQRLTRDLVSDPSSHAPSALAFFLQLLC